MKLIIWTLGWPIAEAVFLAGRAYAFRKYTEKEFVAQNLCNFVVWIIGVVAIIIFA